MKINKLPLVLATLATISSTALSMDFGEEFDWYKKYQPQNAAESVLFNTTNIIDNLLTYHKDNRVKEYLEKNWYLAKDKQFIATHSGFCMSLLYFITVARSNLVLGNWLLTKGAQPADKHEAESIIWEFIEHDKNFNNKALLEIIQNNTDLILKKNPLGTFIDRAKEYNNKNAEDALNSVLHWKKINDSQPELSNGLGDKFLSFLKREDKYSKDFNL